MALKVPLAYLLLLDLPFHLFPLLCHQFYMLILIEKGLFKKYEI